MPGWSESIGETLISDAEIQTRVSELGTQITREYAGKTPILVGVLNGAAIFHADLIRNIDLCLMVDFMAVKSYGAATKSSGDVQLIKDLESSILGSHVILVEDIVDTGLTLQYLLRNLRSREPASLKTCALLTKSSRRQVSVEIEYLGFEVPNRFLVGYGLDHNQRYRNLPYLAVLKELSGVRGSVPSLE